MYTVQLSNRKLSSSIFSCGCISFHEWWKWFESLHHPNPKMIWKPSSPARLANFLYCQFFRIHLWVTIIILWITIKNYLILYAYFTWSDQWLESGWHAKRFQGLDDARLTIKGLDDTPVFGAILMGHDL